MTNVINIPEVTTKKRVKIKNLINIIVVLKSLVAKRNILVKKDAPVKMVKMAAMD